MKNSLIWFRNDLRTIDNTVLSEACKKADSVVGVYCFDPRWFVEGEFGFVRTGPFRTQFLIESVKDLKRELEKLKIPLFVSIAEPENFVPKLVEKFNITNLYYQKEWTRDEVLVNDKLASKLPDSLEVTSIFDQFLFHPEDIPFDDFKAIPAVFTNFRKKVEKYSDVREVVARPQSLPKENLVENLTEVPEISQLNQQYPTPDSRSAMPFKGGESQAWERLQHYFWETKSLKDYKQTRNGLVGIDYSSKFSPWLANGGISARSIYWEVRKFENQEIKNSSTYWLIFELIWRDFFKYISLKHGDRIFHLGGILARDYNWNKDSDVLKKWIEGETQYNFVNANMKELAATGWMSNRGRQNVASFWAKEMQQDWRIGASYFESMLIDYDVHSNWGNWMYNAGVGNDPRDRRFNIERQASMYDENHKFRNRWL